MVEREREFSTKTHPACPERNILIFNSLFCLEQSMVRAKAINSARAMEALL